MVTLSPPTAEAGVRFPARPQVGKLVVACCWSAVYSTETLMNWRYWFPLPFQLPVVIWPVQCWKRRKTPNKKINQPVNAHAEVNILNLNYIVSFIFYSSTNRLSNDVHQECICGKVHYFFGIQNYLKPRVCVCSQTLPIANCFIINTYNIYLF